jgi:Ni,Fe-hydrogenase maturation factor
MNWKLDTEEEYRKVFNIDVIFVKKKEGEIERVRFVQYPRLVKPNKVQVYYSIIRDTGKPISEICPSKGNIWEEIENFSGELSLEEATARYDISINDVIEIINQRLF